jgi:hypothetical protein
MENCSNFIIDFILRDSEHPNLLFNTFALYLLGPGFESRHHSDGFSSDSPHYFPQTMQEYVRKIHIFYGLFPSYPFQIIINKVITPFDTK